MFISSQVTIRLCPKHGCGKTSIIFNLWWARRLIINTFFLSHLRDMRDSRSIFPIYTSWRDVFAGPGLGIHLGYYLPGLKGVVELNLNLAHLGCHFTSCFSYKTLVYSLNSTLGFLICNTAWRSKNPILIIAWTPSIQSMHVTFCGLYRGASTHLVFLQAQFLSPSTTVQFELWGIFKNNRLGWIVDSLSHAKVPLSLSLSLSLSFLHVKVVQKTWSYVMPEDFNQTDYLVG